MCGKDAYRKGGLLKTDFTTTKTDKTAGSVAGVTCTVMVN